MKIVQKVELVGGGIVNGVPIDVSDGASSMNEVCQQVMSIMSERDFCLMVPVDEHGTFVVIPGARVDYVEISEAKEQA